MVFISGCTFVWSMHRMWLLGYVGMAAATPRAPLPLLRLAAIKADPCSRS